MKRIFLTLALFIIPAFFTTATAGSGEVSIFERWFGESIDYPLVYEQYLHQLRVAESEFEDLSLGKEVSQSRLDEVIHRIQSLSVTLDNASVEHRDLPSNVLRRYRQENKKMQHSLETLVSGYEKIGEWHRLIDTMKSEGEALLRASDELVVEATRKGVDAEMVYVMTRQMLLLQRIIAHLNWLSHSNGTEDDVIAVDRIGRDFALYGRVLTGLQVGDYRLGIHALNDASLQKQMETHAAAMKSGVVGKVSPFLELAPVIFKYKMDLTDFSRSIKRLEAEGNPVN